MRSAWKSVYCVFDKNSLFMEECLYDRNRIITLSHVGYRVKVYNGHIYNSFIVIPKMVGHKFGEFSFTKITGSRMAISRNSKKKKNNNL